MNSHEILIQEFKQKSIILISEEDQLSIVSNPVYLPIFESLREGYKTVNEIEEDYTKFIENNIRKQFKKDESEIKEIVAKRKRSIPSLYRYIQNLIDAGFVVLVGKRVAMDEHKTEKLYARTAKLFLNDTYYEKLICSSEVCLESLSKLVELLYGISKPETSTIEDFVSQLKDSFQEITNRLFKEKPEDYVKTVEELSLQEINAVLQTISLIDLVVNRNQFEKLLTSLD